MGRFLHLHQQPPAAAALAMTITAILLISLGQQQHVSLHVGAAEDAAIESARYDRYDNLRRSSGASFDDASYGRVWNVEQGDAADQTNIMLTLRHLTVFLGLTDGEGAAQSSNQDEAIAALLAVHHFNERIADVVPQVADAAGRCPSLRFTVEFFDTEQDPMVASRHLVKDVRKRHGGGGNPGNPGNRGIPDPTRPYPTAIIGADTSVVTEPMVSIASVDGLPLFAHAATATSFDDSDLFGRVVPSLVGDVTAAVDYLSTMLGVKRFGILYHHNEYGLSYMQALQNAAASYGIETVISSFGGRWRSPGETVIATATASPEMENLKRSLETLRKTDYRYIFGIFGSDEYEAVMSEAHRHNMTGPFGYVWLYGDLIGNLPRRFAAVPVGSPLAAVVPGNAFVAVAPPMVPRIDGDGSSSLSGKEAFSSYWEGVWGQERDIGWLEYAKSKLGVVDVLEREMSNSTHNDIDDAPISAFVPLMYDTVIAVALAACNIEGKAPSLHPGHALYESFVKTSLDGASGTVTIDPATGSRNHTTMAYAISNSVITNKNRSGVVEFELRPTDIYLSSTWENVTNFVFPNGTDIPPPDLSEIKMSVVETSTAANIFGLVLCGIQGLLSMGFGIWTAVYRKTRVVKASQPIFLGLVCLGSFIMASALIPMSIEEFLGTNKRGKDIACMATPWCFSVGFVVAFSALIAKLMRVNKIFNAKSHARVTVTPRDVMKPFFILLGLTLALLVSWTIVAPLTFKYIPATFDRYERALEVRGLCKSTRDDWTEVFFSVSMIVIFAIALLYANIEAYKARHISVEFSESRFITISMIIMFQGIVIGVPILFATKNDPTPSQVIGTLLLLLVSFGILLPIFVPKLYFLRKWRAEEADRAEKKHRRLEMQKDFQARIKEGQDEASRAVTQADIVSDARFDEGGNGEREEVGLKISYSEESA